MPRMMWLMKEGGLMKFLAEGAMGRIVEDKEEKRDKLVKVRLISWHILYLNYRIL